MLKQIITNIFATAWPLILIFCVIITSFRVVQLKRSKQTIVLYQELLKLGFLIYILCLFHVVTFQDVSWSTSNMVPFREIFRYQFGSPFFIRNVIGNIVLFLPYGFFISYFLWLEKPTYAIFLSFIASLTIEITQLLIGRVFDIDDILLNIIGGVLGYYLYQMIKNVKQQLPEALKKDLIYNIIVVIMVTVICFYLMSII